MSVHLVPKVTVSPLFIDNLYITLGVSEQDEKEIVKNFFEILTEYPDKTELYNESKIELNTSSGLYHCNKDVYLPEFDEHIRFYCGPKNKKANFLKVEWIPAKVPSTDVADIVNLIIPGGYSELIAYGTITRADITTTIDNIGLSEILYHYPNLKVNKVYFGTGGNESVYLGSPSSENSFTLYDKKKQIKDKNKKKYKIHKVDVPLNRQIQVEYKFRPKKQKVTLSNLSIKGKPLYEKLGILQLKYLPKQKSDFDSLVNMTISNMQTRGFNKTLNMIEGKKRREKVAARIKNLCHAEWWNPADLWKTLPGAIEQVVNPIPNNCLTLKTGDS